MSDKSKPAARTESSLTKRVDVKVNATSDDAKAKAGIAVASDETTAGISDGNPFGAIAGSAFSARPEARHELVERIMSDPRMHDHLDGFESCIQCGICTSACPAARFTEYSPRETARRALDGDETLLTDDSVWYCFYCYTCQSRCPRHNSVAVLNQVIRGLQVEQGHGVQHVEMFAQWGEIFYGKGMGGTPQVFFGDISEMCGAKWRDFVEHRDEVRENLGVGSMYPSDQAADEVRTIMDVTGFRERLVHIGAWGGVDPKGEVASSGDDAKK
jgi:heterodisulfide reductase subunit C1